MLFSEVFFFPLPCHIHIIALSFIESDSETTTLMKVVIHKTNQKNLLGTGVNRCVGCMSVHVKRFNNKR